MARGAGHGSVALVRDSRTKFDYCFDDNADDISVLDHAHETALRELNILFSDLVEDHVLDDDGSLAVAGTLEVSLSKTASSDCRKRRVQGVGNVDRCRVSLTRTHRRRRAVRAADLDRCCPHRWAEGLREDGNRPPVGEEFSPLRHRPERAGAPWDSTPLSCSTKRRRSFSMNGSARRRYGTRYGGTSMICANVASIS